jgi:type II secretory pathway pseudopilin PulG
MIQYFLIAFLAMVLIAAAAILVAVIQGKRVKKAKEETERLREAFSRVQEQAGRLRKALDETARAEEKADGERKELAWTSDSDLVGRANSLFNNGTPGGAGSGTGGACPAGTGSAGDGAGGL